ncbi:Dedicator of cytokinesis protein 1 [Halotydeus destructor]|nr:Dedicator of cytokinesis protein 1 [Halotydeus destructor]
MMRSQVLSGNLPVDELKELAQKITSKIDHGNALLALDLVVRDNQGSIMNADSTSVIEVYRAHEAALRRIRLLLEGCEDESEGARAPKSYHNHNLFVTVMNFVCRIGEDADLFMSLYDAKDMKFISENYLVRWGKEGLMRDLNQLNNLKVLFSDLGSKDLSREKILLVCQIIRIGGMELKENDQTQRAKSTMPTSAKRIAEGLRRPFGVASIDVTDIINGKNVSEEEKQYFVPFMPCGERDSLDTIIKKVVATKGTEAINQKHKGQGLWVLLKMIDGDTRQVVEDYAHLVSPFTPIARKMGFPEVILPGDVRNDLYLTLSSGDFSSKSSNAKNIEVTVKVYNEFGKVLDNVIKVGAGPDPTLSTSEYKSVVYYHEEKPKWMETFKITIPIEEFYESHLRFTFKHRSSNESKDKNEKPFAFAFIKLMNGNGTTLRDQTHELLVYKIDNKKFSESDQVSSQYLNLPSTRSDLEVLSTKTSIIQLNSTSLKSLSSQFSAPGLTLVPKDSFTMSTVICSTKLTQNIDLLGLLKWSIDTPDDNLKTCLYALMKVDGEEIVKFLQDILDALFNILIAKDSEEFDNLVFEALVFIIGLISDIKYEHFRPVLDVYIMENFSATLAYNKLILVLKRYVDGLCKPEVEEDEDNPSKINGLFQHRNSGTLMFLAPLDHVPMRVMKSLEYIFKFIVRSRYLFATLNGGKGRKVFEKSMKDVLNSLISLMSLTDEAHLKIQASCLKYVPKAIPDILTVFDGRELSYILTDLIGNMPVSKLKLQKIYCIHDIVHTEVLFKSSECRKILMPVITEHIRVFMEAKEQLELCVKVISDILVILHGRDVGPTKEDITDLMLSVLRTVIQTVIRVSRDDPMIGNVVALMIGILRQMTPYHYLDYINSFRTQIDLQDFLMEILCVFKDLVNDNVYPKECVDMIMLQNQVILTALKHFSKSIREKFFDPFAHQLWNNFIHCSIAFMTQAPLQLENFTASKRQKIISKYKDMRRDTALEVRSMWYNLGIHKSSFVPELVGPIIEMTLIPEVELRKATIPIFFDMMQSEFYSSPPRSGDGVTSVAPVELKHNFRDFEHEMITQLDRLVEGGRGDENYKQLLFEDLGSLCESHSLMRDKGLHFVQVIVRLMKRLLEYRQVSQSSDENREVRMSCIVNLLEFYNEIGRKEMYIRYLYKLIDLHLLCENYIEAAHTLLLHAKLLDWSDDSLPTPLRNDKYSECETHRDLKERLYIDIIDYFDKGKLWEEGLKICKELLVQYELELYDYHQVASLLQRMSTFYDNIMKQVRLEPEYFRVSYYGKGFPLFMQNKTFVFRGKPCEKLDEFQVRLINQFPNAQLLSSLNIPGEEITNAQCQYLLINKIDPVMTLKPELRTKTIPGQILKYYKVNEVRKFIFSKPKRKVPGDATGRESDNEFTNLWIERTTLVTSYPLPGILRWFPVMEMSTTEISPIKNAIETIENTNAELKSLIIQFSRDFNLPLHPLSMRVNGIVDAAVNGGIGNYEKAFFSEQYAFEHCMRRDRDDINKLKDLIANQVPLLQVCVNIHRERVALDFRPFHDHMESQFRKLRESVEAKYGRKLLPEELREDKLRGKKPAPVFQAVQSDKATPKSDADGSSVSESSRHNSIFVVGSGGVCHPSSNSGTAQGYIANTINRVIRKQINKNIANQAPVEKTLRKSKESNDSVWYVDPNDSQSAGGDAKNKSSLTLTPAPPIELSQSLTTHRPLRSEAEKRLSRPVSGTTLKASSPSKSTGNSFTSLSSFENINDDVEEPPPLPAKTQINSSDFMSESQDTLSDWTSLPRPKKMGNYKGSRKPLPPLPSDGNSPEIYRRHSSVDSDFKVEKVPPEVPRRQPRAPQLPPADYSTPDYITLSVDSNNSPSPTMMVNNLVYDATENGAN